MENKNQGGKQEQLEEHSLPGTNQAGKAIPDTTKPVSGPGSRERSQENQPGAEDELPEQLEKHSLPGTNQAGKTIPSDE